MEGYEETQGLIVVPLAAAQGANGRPVLHIAYLPTDQYHTQLTLERNNPARNDHSAYSPSGEACYLMLQHMRQELPKTCRLEAPSLTMVMVLDRLGTGSTARQGIH